MDDLKFPILKGKQVEPRNLSMDEYDQFVQFNLEISFDREVYEVWKRISAVNVPFVLD